MGKIYGYARCSTKKQDPERQMRNIRSVYPEAKFFFDIFTGAKMDGRKDWNRLMRLVKPGDTIVFDSVSRMSRNEDEGVVEYLKLYDQDIHLKFLKEPHIDTDVYRNALSRNQVPLTGTDVDLILEGVNKYLKNLAETQIRLAFRQAEKELMDIRQRTSEGVLTAKLNGKTIGRKPGHTVVTQKRVHCQKVIRELSRDFDGSMSDKDIIKILGIARHTYYDYKNELRVQHLLEIGAITPEELEADMASCKAMQNAAKAAPEEMPSEEN